MLISGVYPAIDFISGAGHFDDGDHRRIVRRPGGMY
jgi:hypothetical protein